MEHTEPHGGAGAAAASSEEPLAMTPKAIEMAKQTMARERLSEHGLRISVAGGGCSGFQYNLNFDRPKPDDVVCDFGGLQVLVDPTSVQYLKGTTIDYVTGLHGAGFKFVNPNATRTCGCGSSFSA